MSKLNLLVLLVAAFSLSAHAMSKKKEADAPASQTAQASGADAKIWVIRSDGAQSCGTKGTGVGEGAEELKKAGVQTFSQSKGSDGKMYGQACGMPTGSVNAYQILQSDLPKALTAGYKEAPKGFSPKN